MRLLSSRTSLLALVALLAVLSLTWPAQAGHQVVAVVNHGHGYHAVNAVRTFALFTPYQSLTTVYGYPAAVAVPSYAAPVAAPVCAAPAPVSAPFAPPPPPPPDVPPAPAPVPAAPCAAQAGYSSSYGVGAVRYGFGGGYGAGYGAGFRVNTLFTSPFAFGHHVVGTVNRVFAAVHGHRNAVVVRNRAGVIVRVRR